MYVTVRSQKVFCLIALSIMRITIAFLLCVHAICMTQCNSASCSNLTKDNRKLRRGGGMGGGSQSRPSSSSNEPGPLSKGDGKFFDCTKWHSCIFSIIPILLFVGLPILYLLLACCRIMIQKCVDYTSARPFQR